MPDYVCFDNCIITVNNSTDKIIEKIENMNQTKIYKRLGSGKINNWFMMRLVNCIRYYVDSDLFFFNSKKKIDFISIYLLI